MKLAVEMGTIGDGSVEAAIRYCQDLEIEGISVPWGRVPGFKEKGHLEADRVGAFRAQIEDAGIAFAPMVAWVPPAITAGDAEAEVLFPFPLSGFQQKEHERSGPGSRSDRYEHGWEEKYPHHIRSQQGWKDGGVKDDRPARPHVSGRHAHPRERGNQIGRV